MNLHSNITPASLRIYDEARRVALSARDDWPRMLGAAQTLSESPRWDDQSLARHIRDAYSLHLQGLLKAPKARHIPYAVLDAAGFVLFAAAVIVVFLAL